jgi:phenylacetate-CoA ligase
MSVNDPETQLYLTQLSRLRLTLAECLASNDFYREKLKAAGLSGSLPDLSTFFRQMPFTTKASIVADQQSFPPFGSNLTYSLDCYTRYHQTSGSTGTPMRWLDTPESWQGLLHNWRQVLDHAGVTARDRIFFTFSFGPFLGFWTAFDAAQQMGCLCIPGGGMRSNARLRAILDNQVTVICCTPTYALHLGELARAEGINLSLSRVQRILVAGEPGGCVPAVREKIQSFWPNATVFDHHGMTEIGPASFQRRDALDRLYIIEESFLAEILDPVSGQPVRKGQTGELVITTLNRVGSPLLRYRTGDLVRQEPSDQRGLALKGGILSRCDDMVIVRGVNVYPSAVEAMVRRQQHIVEYRVTLFKRSQMTEMRVEIEARKDPEETASKLAKELQSAFNMRVDVQPVEAQSLPRFEMKARRWFVQDKD